MSRQGRYARRRTTNDKPSKQDTKETVMEFVPHVAGKHQTVTYDAVKEHILQEMQIDLRNGHEIIEYLQTEKKNYQETKPVRQIAVSEGTSDTTKAIKQQQDSYNFKFNIQYKERENRERKRTSDTPQIIANLLKYSSDSQIRI